jgi:phenylacetate-CoA oxygenase PaaJ subunit
VVTEEAVRAALAKVVDPEYAISILDLGLIYDVAVVADAVRIAMTFTSIGCPAIEMLTDDVRAAVAALPGVQHVHVDVVWSPPWTRDRISPRGRQVLAMYGVASGTWNDVEETRRGEASREGVRA